LLAVGAVAASVSLRGFRFYVRYIVCYIVRYRRKIVMDNLCNAFPEKTEKERRQIARKFYRFLCDVTIKTVKLANIDTAQIHRRIKYFFNSSS